eukprot:COSAG03_NODE_29768_length_177_cov_36.820513_1_plen_26_part_01
MKGLVRRGRYGGTAKVNVKVSLSLSL